MSNFNLAFSSLEDPFIDSPDSVSSNLQLPYTLYLPPPVMNAIALIPKKKKKKLGIPSQSPFFMPPPPAKTQPSDALGLSTPPNQTTQPLIKTEDQSQGFVFVYKDGHRYLEHIPMNVKPGQEMAALPQDLPALRDWRDGKCKMMLVGN